MITVIIPNWLRGIAIAVWVLFLCSLGSVVIVGVLDYPVMIPLVVFLVFIALLIGVSVWVYVYHMMYTKRMKESEESTQESEADA